MSTTVFYRIGDQVRTADGEGSSLRGLVIDPEVNRLTHLVVEDRLVPVDLIEDSLAPGEQPQDAGEGIRLRCTDEEFRRLDPVEEVQPVDVGTGPQGPAPVEQALLVPAYGLGAAGFGWVPQPVFQADELTTEVHEVIPPGEEQIRRGDRVEAVDGEVGHVRGLAVQPHDSGVTHVLLREGHLWGKKTVAIPIGETGWNGGRLTVRMSKAQLADLPETGLD